MAAENLKIATADGIADAWFVPATAGAGKPVLLFMDAMGLRPALMEMAERLSQMGYSVLMPDLFYRSQPYGPFDPKTIFEDRDALRQLGKMNRAFANDLFARDLPAYLEALSLRSPGMIGAVGYCMGGRCALMAAGHEPGRIGAAASFHGGELAPDRPDGPQMLAAAMKAQIYIGVAETDAFFEGEEEGRLLTALRSERVIHTLETYPGTQHGFAVPDLAVFHAAAAERHWQRLDELFSACL